MAGRPQNYERSKIIQSATQLFWLKGYAGTSLTDLTQHMGISKSTFYTVFASKDELYQICLEEYGKHFFKEMVLMVSAEHNVLDSLRKFLIRIAREEAVSPPAKGCMLVRSANEIGTNHPSLGPVIKKLLSITRSTFQHTLDLAIRRNELPETFNTLKGAAYLTTHMCGLRTLARAGFATEELESLVDTILINLRAQL